MVAYAETPTPVRVIIVAVNKDSVDKTVLQVCTCLQHINCYEKGIDTCMRYIINQSINQHGN